MSEDLKYLQAKMLDVIQRAGEKGLERDSITFIIALEEEINMNKALVRMILDGTISAEFTGGDKDNRLDSNLYKLIGIGLKQ